MVSPGDLERERALLSPIDRKYLDDPEGYAEENSRAAEKKRKDAIKHRVRHGLLDLRFVFDTLDDDELHEVVGGHQHTHYLPEDTFEGAVGTIALLLLVGDVTALFDPDKKKGSVHAYKMIHAAVQKVATREGYTLDTLEFRPEGQKRPRAALREYLKDGEELPPEDLAFLMRAEGIDTGEVGEVVREQLLAKEEEEEPAGE